MVEPDGNSAVGKIGDLQIQLADVSRLRFVSLTPLVRLLRWLKFFAIVYPSFANSLSPRTERTVRVKLP
jgi:hypothetical protein